MPRYLSLIAFLLVSLLVVPTWADEPPTLQRSWRGDVSFFATGAPLAADEDGDHTVETDIQPASVVVNAIDDIPLDAEIEQAYVYWAGTRYDADCTSLDNEVTLTVPNDVARSIVADECYCAEGATTYDQQVCRYDMTRLIIEAGGELSGTYTLGDFSARIQNGATDNASFSVVLVYRHDAVNVQHVLLYDGIWELYESSTMADHQQVVFPLGGFEIDNPPSGALTYYVMEGDIGGGGSEGVKVEGQPGSKPEITLEDSINPANNPFNRTINTVTPPQTDVVGVDIDRFSLDAAVDAGDTSVDVTIDGGGDKIWLVYTIIEVVVFEPIFDVYSTLQWNLLSDQNGDGFAGTGDTIRLEIRLMNSGNEEGTTNLHMEIPAEMESWSVAEYPAGDNLSSGNTFAINNVTIPVGHEYLFAINMTVGDVTDGDQSVVLLTWTAPPEGGTNGSLSTLIEYHRDQDGDLVYDSEDNCPTVANASQADRDNDGAGDLCDPCPDDNPDDSDGDTVCDSQDICPGADDTVDADGDGVPYGCDICRPGDDKVDTDGDGIPDDCDHCSAGSDGTDSDGDGTPDACDLCPGSNDNEDSDGDGVPNGCDLCAAGDDSLDADGDGIPNACDTCEGDTQDSDGDGVADACDRCPGADDNLDADGDSVPDGCDVCAAGNDLSDTDNDGTPDACDICASGDDQEDTDGDGIPNGCDDCAAGDDRVDDDGDGVPNACDLCPLGDDRIDSDGDGIPDDCQSEICDDGQDNDDNGLVDCDDPVCAQSTKCTIIPSEQGAGEEDCSCHAVSHEPSPRLAWLGLLLIGLFFGVGIRRHKRR